MKNHSVIDNGVRKWISRHVAVAGFIFSKDKKGNWYVLANKRGEGCPDFVGYWNCPCGYLDYDETTKEAIAREVREETGLKLESSKFKLDYINDSPENSDKQNVTFSYHTKVISFKNLALTTAFSEKEEVAEIKWIKLTEIHNYEWAFNHLNIIENIFKKHYKENKIKKFFKKIW